MDGGATAIEQLGGNPIDCLMEAATAMIGAAVEEGGGRKKRGRPTRKAAAATEEEEGEDVCFLCFDGGSLVLCDRRGCPKAYHPACVKRDEAFFQSKAKWNCGWHICSICQKAAHHMCYTCTYSLCKTCTKDSDYLSVRGNKGFCAPCMRTVMLIEDIAPRNKETVQVDFDDKTSWEYLFKMYWIYLKGKLSLTLDELTQAKKPCKEVVPIARKEQRLDVFNSNSDCKSSISNVPLDLSDSKKRRKKEQLILPCIVDCQNTDKCSGKSSTLSGSKEWATKELLEFVAHMRNGDLSMLLPFDVQGLLLEYIKRNNLRDPQKKSQIICDARLTNLFLKPRVGHFEMLKLLEYHFLIKEDNHKEDTLDNIRAPNHVEGGGNNESFLKTESKIKKRKVRRKGEERGQQTNLDEFAAIDVHNIKLIYLRRSLMENLVTSSGNFLDKVLGSIVRIRISTADLKQDMYRLVQVVGTFKASVPYKIGGKTVDVMLKILNLNKKELVAIDAISNQDFSEDECRRFRQSIKCGFLKRMTVGQVQEKARALQEVRLNDCLEAEILRLNHLRDRASENGRKKELRECVEKIDLLKTPEERQRRLNKNPQVHADPKMDPKCESDDDTGEIHKQKQADQVKSRKSGFKKLGRDPISMQNKIKQAKLNLEKGPSSRLGKNVPELQKKKDANVSKPPTVSVSNGSPPSASNSEIEKIWHYRDPSGNIQGPFCIIQLRKWSTSGYFPPDMMVWNINSEEVESLHLADVLSGNFHKALPLRSSTALPFYVCEDRHSSTVNPTIVNDGKLNNGSWNCSSATSNGNISSNGNNIYANAVHENQTDSHLFSAQSSVESWRPSAVNTAPVKNLGFEELPSPTPKASGREEKASLDIQNSPILRMMIDTDEKVDSSIGNSPSLLLTAKDRDEKIPVTESTPPATAQNPHISSPKRVDDDVKGVLGIQNMPSPSPNPRDRDKKADIVIPNLPSPSQKTVDGDVKMHPPIQNMPSSSPESIDDDVKGNLGFPNLPSLSNPRSRDEKADMLIQNLPSPSRNSVNDDVKMDLPIQKIPSSSLKPIDLDMEVPTNQSKPPGINLILSSATLKDRDEKAGSSIKSLSSPSPKIIDEGGNVDPTAQKLPSSPQDARDGNENVQTHNSTPPSTGLNSTSSPPTPSSVDEKACISIKNIPSLSPKTVDEERKIDSTVQILSSLMEGKNKVGANRNTLTSTSLTCSALPPDPDYRDDKAVIDIQNLSSASPNTANGDGEADPSQRLPKNQSYPEDGNEKAQSIKNTPLVTGVAEVSSKRDEKAVVDIQNLSSASPNTANGDGEADPSQRLPKNPSYPEDGNEKAQSIKSMPPVTGVAEVSSKRDEKAVIDIQNLPSTLPKTVNGDGEADPTEQKLPKSPSYPQDRNEKAQSIESKPHVTEVICLSSIVEVSKRDDKANVNIHNLPSPSPKMVDENEKVDLTPNTRDRCEKVEVELMACENPPNLCNSEAVTNCDQFASPSTSNHLFSPSNGISFDYEPIEFMTLGDDLVSDLLAEVDAMEVHGDVAMYPDDDFFDFVKSDGVNEPHGSTEYDIFDHSKRSNGEASTSNIERVDTWHNHDLGNQAEIGPNNQIISNNLEGNINSGFGGLTQGMAYMGWGSNPGLAQVNMDINENTSFGFMGHERQR